MTEKVTIKFTHNLTNQIIVAALTDKPKEDPKLEDSGVSF